MPTDVKGDHVTATRPTRPVGRPSGPTDKGTSTRRHILDAAAAVFSELGYDKARMNDLISATGLTKGAVYFHFDSKEALAVAVLEAKQDSWLEAVRRRLDGVAPGHPRLTALLPAMLQLHDDDPSTWAIAKLTRNLSELPTTRASAATLTRRWMDYIASLIREAQRRGQCPDDIDPLAAATVLIGAFDGLKAIHDTLADADDPSFSAATELLGDMALAYLGPGQRKG